MAKRRTRTITRTLTIQLAPRGKYQGATQLLRFNWPFYFAALLFLLAAGFAIAVVSIPNSVRVPLSAAILLAAFWLTGSLAIAHYIYDRSPIYHGTWIEQALRHSPAGWANFHSGLDEFSGTLQALFPGSNSAVVDFFDAKEMTEPSISRARRLAQNPLPSTRADFRALPLQDAELDAAFLFFAAHELRKAASRIQFFRELRRVLRSNGQIVLLEHLRDWRNFLAFGPGCFHFHSRGTWINTIESAGLTVSNEFYLTPFVRAFVIEKLPLSNV